jgi:hypothetical protein
MGFRTVVSMTSTLSTSTAPTLDDLAHFIAADGIRQHEADIASLVVRLRSLGYDGSLTDLLADRGAAPIARERSFGILVGELARGPARSGTRAAACNPAA